VSKIKINVWEEKSYHKTHEVPTYDPQSPKVLTNMQIFRWDLKLGIVGKQVRTSVDIILPICEGFYISLFKLVNFDLGSSDGFFSFEPRFFELKWQG
jgi:hypothetical protein